MAQDHDPFPDLHAACAALGTRLFTVTALDDIAGLHRRVYTSHPQDYPISGTKPLGRDGWYDACIAARRTFVANTPPEFARYFPDHALIASLGLGSCINIPVAMPVAVLGTVNLLAEANHFTRDRIAAYEKLVAAANPALSRALTQALKDQDPMPAKPAPTPMETFLAPLARLARKHPDIEGLVFWGGSEGWGSSPSEALEAEEIAFYAEGLLLDGFYMDWSLIEDAEALTRDLRLCFWQEGDPPPLPPKAWKVLEAGRWTPPADTPDPGGTNSNRGAA